MFNIEKCNDQQLCTEFSLHFPKKYEQHLLRFQIKWFIKPHQLYQAVMNTMQIGGICHMIVTARAPSSRTSLTVKNALMIVRVRACVIVLFKFSLQHF